MTPPKEPSAHSREADALEHALRRQVRHGRALLVLSALLSCALLAAAVLVVAVSPADEPLVQLAASAFFFPFAAVVLHRYRMAADRMQLAPINSTQLPEVHQVLEELCQEAGLSRTPRLFLTRDPGVDPCTVTPGLRPHLVLGTDFLAGCRENSTPEALRFMLAHQVGHVVLGHHTRRWVWLSTAILGTPVLKGVFIRRLERSADLWAARAVPEGAERALALCAVGKDNYPYLRGQEQIRHWEHRRDLMGHLAHLSATQVSASERLSRLHRSGLRLRT